MKKVMAILLCLTVFAAVLTLSPAALTEEEANAGYYLVGSMTGWQITLNGYRFSQNPQNADEYMLSGVSLTTSDSFKVVYTHDGHTIDEWFPFGTENNCNLAAQDIFSGGPADIYFRPDLDGAEDWFFGCIYIESREQQPDPEPTPTEPDGKAGYYFVTESSGWTVNQNNLLVNYYGDIYEKGNVTLSAGDRIKVVYSPDGRTVEQWYPSEEDEGLEIEYNSIWFTVQFYAEGNCPEDSYKGFIQVFPCEPPVSEGPIRFIYKDKFTAVFPGWTEKCTYDEVYYHNDGDNDWALIRADGVYPLYPGYINSFLPEPGVFDEVVAFNYLPPVLNGKKYFGFFVYDVKNDTFYDIGEAWDMDFPDLHDVFVCYAKHYLDAIPLGDADLDGELSIVDVTLLQRFLADITDLSRDGSIFAQTPCICGPDIKYLTDFNCDGERDITDATAIQRHLVGISIYPHDFTAYAHIGTSGSQAYAQAMSSFGSAPVEYCYTIDGGLHAYSVYGDDFGQFTYNDPDYEPEPGDFHITTGYIPDDEVELPLRALTYEDDFTLTVTARDRYGNVSKPVIIDFVNVY